MISQVPCRKYTRKLSKHHSDSLLPCRTYCSNRMRGCKATDRTGGQRRNTISIQCTVQMTPPFDERAAPDVIEHTASEFGHLKDTLNSTIARRDKLISQSINRHSADRYGKLIPESNIPQARDIADCLSVPSTPTDETLYQAQAPMVSTFIGDDNISVWNDLESDLFSVTNSRAACLFAIYDELCNPLLPIFPTGFFVNLDLARMASTNELLFWTIILTGILHSDEPQSPTEYRQLADKIQRLVVKQCWLNTPRSVHILLALVILTTWPIPSNSSRLFDNYSLKLISLANSLCVQLGLHRLEFIAEFSHKTDMDISPNAQLNNTIRERIFKLIHVNSNYWHIHLGLLNNNSSNVPNHILTNAISADSLKSPTTKNADLTINCLLKSCMLQTKINESMSDLIGGLDQNKSILLLPDQTSVLRAINLNMFEVILEDCQREIEQASLNQDEQTRNLLHITLEYAKLQLYLYALADDGTKKITRNEYHGIVRRTISCCMRIVLLCGEMAIHKMHIYYRFPAEMASLILLRIYKSPVLKNPQQYAMIKRSFNTLYLNVIAPYSGKPDWSFHSSRLDKILHKFDSLANTFIASRQKSFALVNRTQNYLACAMSYDMIWLIYEHHHTDSSRQPSPVNWKIFGHVKDDEVVNFIMSNSLIFI